MIRKVMSDENKKALEAENEKANDWYAVCPKCGQRLTGTLAQLREHNCGNPRT